MQSPLYRVDPSDPRTWGPRPLWERPDPLAPVKPSLSDVLGARAQGSTVSQYRKGLGDTLEAALPRYFAGLQGEARDLVRSYLFVSQRDRRTGGQRRPDSPMEGDWAVPADAVATALAAVRRGETDRLRQAVDEFKAGRSAATGRRQAAEAEVRADLERYTLPGRPTDEQRRDAARLGALSPAGPERQVQGTDRYGDPVRIAVAPGVDAEKAIAGAAKAQEAVTAEFAQRAYGGTGGQRLREAAGAIADSVSAFAQKYGLAGAVAPKLSGDLLGGLAATPVRILEEAAFLTDEKYQSFVNPGRGASARDMAGAFVNLALDLNLVDPLVLAKPLAVKAIRALAAKFGREVPEMAAQARQVVSASDGQIGQGVREATLQDVKRKARADARRAQEPQGQGLDLVRMAQARSERAGAPYQESEWRDLTAQAEKELRKVGKHARANQLRRSLQTGVVDPEVDALLREELTQRASIGEAHGIGKQGTEEIHGDVRQRQGPPEGAGQVPAEGGGPGVRQGGQGQTVQEAVESPQPEVQGPVQAGAATEPTGPRRVSDILGEKSEALDAKAQAIRERMRARAEKGFGGQLGAGLGGFDPRQFAHFQDAIELGAVHLAKAGTDFAKWSAKMVEDFGDSIQPHLRQIYDRLVAGADDVDQTAREAMAEASAGPSMKGAAPDERLRLQDLEKVAQDAGISLDGLRARRTFAQAAQETAEGFDAYADSVRSLAKADLAPNQSITANQRLAGHVLAKDTAQEVAAAEDALRAAQEAGDAEGAMRASAQLAAKEEELAKVVRLLYKTGSTDGFNLAMHRYRLADYDAARDLVRMERLSHGTATPEQRRRLVELTEQAKRLREKVAELQRAQRAGAAPDKAIARLEKDVAALDAKRAQLMANAAKPTLLDEVTMWWQASLLTNPRTIIRNFVGSAVNAARDEGLRSADWLADQVVRAVAPRATEGRQAVKALVPGGTKKWGQTFEKSVEDVKSVWQTGITPEEAARLDVRQESRFALTKYALRFQGIQDKPWFNRAYVQSLWEQASLIKKSNKAEDLLPLVEDPTEAMQVQAMQDAAMSTFSEANRVADFVAGFGKDSPVARFLVRLLVPFVKVPTNIGKRILKANVLGTAADVGSAVAKVRARGTVEKVATAAGEVTVKKPGTLTPFEQRQLAKSITDGTLGTALLWYGYDLAAQGKAIGKAPESGKERETMYLTGRQPSDVQIGGTSLRTAGTHPLFSLITLGAALHGYQAQEAERFGRESERYEKLRKQGVPESELDKPVEPKGVGPSEVLKATKDVLLEFPFFKGMKDVVSDTSDFEGFLANLGASFVPGLPGDVRQTVAFDPKMRDPRARRGALQQLRDQVYMKLGIREQVPQRVDPFGNAPRQARPWDVSGARSNDDPVAQMVRDTGLLLDVERQTNLAKSLTPDQLLERQIETGQKVYATLSRDVQSYRDYAERWGKDSLQRAVDAQVRDIRAGKEPRPLLPPDPRTGGVQERPQSRSYSGLSGLPR